MRGTHLARKTHRLYQKAVIIAIFDFHRYESFDLVPRSFQFCGSEHCGTLTIVGIMLIILHVCCELKAGYVVACYKFVQTLYMKTTRSHPGLFLKHLRKYKAQCSLAALGAASYLSSHF